MVAHYLTTLDTLTAAIHKDIRSDTIHGTTISQSMARLAQFNSYAGSKITFAY